MLRQVLLTGWLAAGFATGLQVEVAQAQPAQSQEQDAQTLNRVKDAILAATAYDGSALELTAAKAQLVVTIVNSKLLATSAVEREGEARRIALTIEGVIAGKPEFKNIQAIHVDYVARDAGGGHTRTVDGIDFRKDPKGKFQHHMT